MMKTTSFLLSLQLCLVQGVEKSQGRFLQENGDNNGGGYTQYDQYKAELSYKFETAKYQVEQDLDGMWHTTPSEWGDEYWEVFIGIIGLALAITFCFMLICCTPCCSSYDNDSPRYVATQEEYDARRRMKEPILDSEEKKRTGERSSQDASPQKYRSSEDPPIKSKMPRQRRRRTLWEETVIVWKDFFRNGLYVPEDTMSHYTLEAREEQRRRRSRSSSRKRRSSSGNKRRGEMV